MLRRSNKLGLLICPAAFALLLLLIIAVVSCESFAVGGVQHPSHISSKTTTSRLRFSSSNNESNDNSNDNGNGQDTKKIEMKTWNPFRLLVLKAGFTEPMFTSPLNYEKRDGFYSCSYCGAVLFDASSKYDSGSGWPSFWRSTKEGATAYKRELDGRLECQCGTCKSHLGHVFPDGPNGASIGIPKDLVTTMPASDPKPVERLPRFCINGASLRFTPRQ